MENAPVKPEQHIVPTYDPSFMRTGKRLLRESGIPLLAAAAYAAWDTWASLDHLAIGPFLKVFGPAFFLFMWFAGQFLRVKKQLHDRDLLTGINADVGAIKAALADRRAIGPAPIANDASAPPIPEPVAAELVNEAEAALNSGFNRSALLLIASAFEYSVRHAARVRSLPEGPRVSLRRTVNALDTSLPDGVRGELDALWDARNRIVHATDGGPLSKETADRLFTSFRWAIALLANTTAVP